MSQRSLQRCVTSCKTMACDVVIWFVFGNLCRTKRALMPLVQFNCYRRHTMYVGASLVCVDESVE